MQDIVFYAAANETLGIVRDYTNSRNEYAPTLVLGVSVCLRMRLFANSESAVPYPLSSFTGITSWKWRMDSDFDRETPYKLNADNNGISVRTVTDTLDGESMSFTEFEIPISDMNTLELATWLGTDKKKSGLTGELVGYDSSGNAVFVLQVDDFTVRNRVAGLNEPTSNDQEYLTRSQTELLVQSAVSSSAATKQDKLTSANAGAGIAIDSGGTISNTYSLPYATSSSAGGVMLAAGAEIVSGTNGSKAITPAALKAALSGGTQFVPRDAVSAFMNITDLGSATNAALTAGKAYKLIATSGEHTLTTGTLPALSYGADSHIELFVGASTLVHVSDPLILMDALIPNAVNNCVVKFRDGEARMYVEDHDAGYTVTLSGGTGGTGLDGSLYYGITGTTQSYIAFAHSLDGQTVTLPSAVTASRDIHIVGNGNENTDLGAITLTGSGNPNITVSNAGFSGQLNVESLTLNINNCLFDGCPDGALGIGSGVVAVISGSTFGTATDTIQMVSGSTIGFSGSDVLNSTVSGAGRVVFTGGATVTSTIPDGSTIGTGQISAPFYYAGANPIALSDLSITGVTATTGIGTLWNVTMTNVRVVGNTNTTNTAIMALGGTCSISGSTFSNRAQFGNSGVNFLANTVARFENCLFSQRSGSTTNSNITIILGGTITFVGSGGAIRLTGTGTKTRVLSGTLLDASDVTGNDALLVASTISVGAYNDSGEWIVGGTASVIPLGGGDPVTVSGSGSTLSTAGEWVI